MTQQSVKISSKYQIAVPSEIRKELQLEAGDHLIATTLDGVILLIPRRMSALKQLKGLHAEIWADEDIDAFIENERDAWDAE